MEFLLQIINGLQIGSIYALVSLGYTMVYGIAQLINFAHGDIIMIGAYTSLFSIPLFTSLGLPIWATVIPAIIICALIGCLAERIAYRPLRNSPRISNLITAIGVSLFIENVFMKVFTPNTRSFPKIFTQAPISFGNGINISFGAVVTIVTTLVLSIALQLFMKKTKYGKAMIATSQDYAIKAFVAAVLGGIGILPGAVLGGFILGIVESLTRAYLSSQLADAFVFSILIIVLLFKPTGILGKNVKEKV